MTSRRSRGWILLALAIAAGLLAYPVAAQDPEPPTSAGAWWSTFADRPPGVYVLSVDSLLPLEAESRDEIDARLEAFDAADRPARFDPLLPLEWILEVEWSRPEPGLCESTDARIFVRTVSVRPDLATWDDLDEDIRYDWHRFLRALRDHHAGHREIVMSRLTDLRHGLRDRPALPCDAYADTVEALRDRVEREVRQRHAAYDEETDHGRAEGAVWPPVLVPSRPAAAYTVVEPTPLPDSVHEVWADGRFEVRVVRSAANEMERALITRAESLVPREEVVEAAAAEERARGGAWLRAQEEAAARPGPRWWWREWDYVWLPFALTGEAVDHYMTRVRELAAGANPFGSSDEHTASVDYRATIERIDDERMPEVAYEVHMRVRFGFWCGMLCALDFRHGRTVRFDAAGEVLEAAGDARPEYVVS